MELTLTNKDVQKFELLVYKIAHQFESISKMPFDDLVQIGYIGVINAYKTYNEGTSQSFKQYVGWQVRYAIQNANNNDNFLSGYSLYKRSKGESCSLSYIDNPQKTNNIREICKTNDEINQLPKILELLYTKLENVFSKRDCEIFYKTYGLKTFDYYKGKELSIEYNVSNGCITQINKRIINYIRKNDELIEYLKELV